MVACPEMTRGSITGQVKALSMIVAMQNLIPERLAGDRLSVSLEKKSPPAPTLQIDAAACLPRPAVGRAGQQVTTSDPQPGPAQQKDEPTVPEPKLAPGRVLDPPPDPGPASPPSRPGVPLRQPLNVTFPCLLLFQTWEFLSL
ncbi:MAG TPA: hypothetical protein VFE27_20055 [Acidobacteriaceae bacterium]|nr:hypothetical protein [Acidobacteriaceae bacterium]